MEVQAKRIAYDLRFFGIHQNIDSRSQEAVSKNLHPLEFLSLILEDERQKLQTRSSIKISYQTSEVQTPG
jgi:hypothetical protein